MAHKREKSGKELMSEMAHTMTFLKAMGWDTETMNVALVVALKTDILNAITPQIGEPENRVKDAF